jgi:hypothetical protein
VRPLLFLALLEVMDKEPGIIGFWIGAIVLGALGFQLARRRWWWALPVLALLSVSVSATWGEWTDPWVGPAIAAEAGRWYPYHLFASAALATGLTIVGMVRGRRAP